jgi:PAS domain S-box-containing protein
MKDREAAANPLGLDPGLQALHNLETVGVQGYEPDGLIFYWNLASERLYGFSAAEALGKNLLDLIVPPDQRGDLREEMRRALESGENPPPRSLRLLRKDGTFIAVQYSLCRVLRENGTPGFVCFDIDLTQNLHAEQRAQEFHAAIEQSASGQFDLILMDVQMPVMDGLECTRRLRANASPNGGKIPILGLTAHASPEDLENCRRAGMDDVLTKPVNPAALAQKIAMLLQSNPSPDNA